MLSTYIHFSPPYDYDDAVDRMVAPLRPEDYEPVLVCKAQSISGSVFLRKAYLPESARISTVLNTNYTVFISCRQTLGL